MLHPFTELGVGTCGFPSPQRAGMSSQNDLQKRPTRPYGLYNKRQTARKRDKKQTAEKKGATNNVIHVIVA